MNIFYFLLISTFLLGLISRIINKNYKIIGILFPLIIASLFILVAGFRTEIGDTYFYKHSYELLVQNPMLPEDGRDIGFTVFQLCLISISTNPQFLVFVTSLITNLCTIIGLYRYRNYFELQVYMFITSGYFLTTMNGIRQAMVAAILFCATPLILKNRKWLYFLLVILLFNIHESALIMIPVYYIVREEPWSKRIMLLVAFLGIGLVLYDILEPIIFDLLGSTNYGHYSEFDEGGSSFMRTFIAFLPVAGAYILRKDLKSWDNGKVFINMSLLNFIVLCFSMYNWIFARLSYYFLPYTFVLLPYLIMRWPNIKEKRILYYGFILCYFIYMYYEHVIQGLGLGYKMIPGIF